MNIPDIVATVISFALVLVWILYIYNVYTKHVVINGEEIEPESFLMAAYGIIPSITVLFYGLVINKICNGHRDWLFSIIDIWGSIIILLVAYQLLLYKLRTSTIVYKGKK